MTEDTFAALAAGWRQMVEIYQRAWSDALGLQSTDPEAGLDTLKEAWTRMDTMARQAEGVAASNLAGSPAVSVELAAAGARIEALSGRLSAIETALLALAAAGGPPPKAKKGKQGGDGKKGKRKGR